MLLAEVEKMMATEIQTAAEDALRIVARRLNPYRLIVNLIPLDEWTNSDLASFELVVTTRFWE